MLVQLRNLLMDHDVTSPGPDAQQLLQVPMEQILLTYATTLETFAAHTHRLATPNRLRQLDTTSLLTLQSRAREVTSIVKNLVQCARVVLNTCRLADKLRRSQMLRPDGRSPHGSETGLSSGFSSLTLSESRSPPCLSHASTAADSDDDETDSISLPDGTALSLHPAQPQPQPQPQHPQPQPLQQQPLQQQPLQPLQPFQQQPQQPGQQLQHHSPPHLPQQQTPPQHPSPQHQQQAFHQQQQQQQTGYVAPEVMLPAPISPPLTLPAHMTPQYPTP
mmetsp:Transcript_54742/g.129382  ORF Transcript_54742/g.129382 Transcript_54742/m.129382 type:complete len:276 (+) Transcript_54742:1-828(+)